MKIRHCFGILPILALALFLTACTEETYYSHIPRFDGFRITDTIDGSSSLRINRPLKVVAHQSEQGSLLYKAQYTWSISPADSTSFSTSSQSVIYDNDKSDPTTVLTVKKVGTYVLTMTAKYWMSTGNADMASTKTTIDGGSVTYSYLGSYYYQVAVSKTISVGQ